MMCNVHCAICAIRDVFRHHCVINIAIFSKQYRNTECTMCNMCNMECFLALLHGDYFLASLTSPEFPEHFLTISMPTCTISRPFADISLHFPDISRTIP